MACEVRPARRDHGSCNEATALCGDLFHHVFAKSWIKPHRQLTLARSFELDAPLSTPGPGDEDLRDLQGAEPLKTPQSNWDDPRRGVAGVVKARLRGGVSRTAQRCCGGRMDRRGFVKFESLCSYRVAASKATRTKRGRKCKHA
jgi:hypothetical protein